MYSNQAGFFLFISNFLSSSHISIISENMATVAAKLYIQNIWHIIKNSVRVNLHGSLLKCTGMHFIKKMKWNRFVGISVSLFKLQFLKIPLGNIKKLLAKLVFSKLIFMFKCLHSSGNIFYYILTLINNRIN